MNDRQRSDARNRSKPVTQGDTALTECWAPLLLPGAFHQRRHLSSSLVPPRPDPKARQGFHDMLGPSPPPWGLSYAAAPLLLPGVAAPFSVSGPLSSSLGSRSLDPRCLSPRVFLRCARPDARDGWQRWPCAARITCHTPDPIRPTAKARAPTRGTGGKDGPQHPAPSARQCHRPVNGATMPVSIPAQGTVGGANAQRSVLPKASPPTVPRTHPSNVPQPPLSLRPPIR